MLRCEIIPPDPHELCCEIIRTKIARRARLRQIAFVLCSACAVVMSAAGFRAWLERPPSVAPVAAPAASASSCQFSNTTLATIPDSSALMLVPSTITTGSFNTVLGGSLSTATLSLPHR